MAVDMDDIQGLLVAGYGNLKAACFVLLEIADPRAAARWLSATADNITSGQAKPETQAMNLALTPTGLQKLGLKPETIAMFSDEFVSGMTTPHRRRILGDSDENAPERWRWGGPANPAVDILLMLYGVDENGIDALYASHAETFGAAGLPEIEKLLTAPLDAKEPFGFNDGISQPAI